jgi:phosphatidylcholine synthase
MAWCVHAYTALGLVAAAGMAVLAIDGQQHEASFRWAFLLMLLATLVDCTDGVLARTVRVSEVLPGFDGRRLDDIVDFLTYTAMPLLLIWCARILPPAHQAWLLAPLLASAYGFSQVSAKTADGYFLGFPSYWNVVAFYLYVLDRHVVRLPGWFSIGVLAGFALLVLVPVRYLYPSQGGPLNRLTTLLGLVWVVLVVGVACLMPTAADGSPASNLALRGLLFVSLGFPAYYMVASWAISWRIWRQRCNRGVENALDSGGPMPPDGDPP